MMPKFRVVIERSLGIHGRDREHKMNPFHIRDILRPGLTCEMLQRVWDDMECESESEIRRWFDRSQDEGLEAVAGFRIVSIEKLGVSNQTEA